jgi:glutamate synthase domain-containing protein 3
LIESADVRVLHELISRHWALTGSRRARGILDNWSEMLPRFIKVFPHEFKRVLGVNRIRRPYIPGDNLPGENLPVVAAAEQVSHG